MYIYTCICRDIYICLKIHMYVHWIHGDSICMFAYRYVDIHIFMYVYTYMYIYKCRYRDIYIFKYTYVCKIH